MSERSYPRYEMEVVPRSAIRKDDVLLDISSRGVFELRVISDPEPLGPFAKMVHVCWPGEEVQRDYSLGERGSRHLRIARHNAESRHE